MEVANLKLIFSQRKALSSQEYLSWVRIEMRRIGALQALPVGLRWEAVSLPREIDLLRTNLYLSVTFPKMMS